jgi:DHA1 family tetracycline resistance protein-like MFS transporter
MNRTLVVLSAIVATDMIGFGIVIPLLPFYSEALGATPFDLSLIIACYPAAQLLAFPLIGRLSDLFGRKPLIVACLVVSVASYLMLGFAETLPALLASRVMAGFGGATYTAAQAYVADITDESGRTSAITRLGGGYAIGLVLGPIIGGYASFYDFGLAGFIAAAISAVSLVLAGCLLPNTHRARAAARRDQAPLAISEWVRAYARPPLCLLVGTLFLAAAAFEGTMSMLALFLERKIALTVQDAGMLWAWSGAVVVGIRLGLAGQLAHQLGDKPCVLLGLGLLAGGAACVLVTTNFAFALAAASLLAAGYSIVFPTMISLTSKLGAAASQGSILGGYMLFGGLGRTIGPLLSGLAFQRAGVDTPMIAAVIAFTAAACLALAFPAIVTSSQPAE